MAGRKKSQRRDLSLMMDSVAEMSQLDPKPAEAEAVAPDPPAPATVEEYQSNSPTDADSTPPAVQATDPTPALEERDEPSSSPEGRTRRTKKSRSSTTAEAEARKQRDADFAAALQARGLDPATFTAPQGRTKGSVFRPTIELSPEERAGISAAIALRPDLFASLVDFVRHFALNWDGYLDERESAHLDNINS